MGVLQASCSDLVLLVDKDRAEEVLWRALEYGKVLANLYAYLILRREGSRITYKYSRVPGDARFVLRRREGGAAVTLENYEVYEALPYVVLETRTDREDVTCGASIRLAYDELDGGALALFYDQHCQDDLYPLLARLSYEFRAPVAPFSGGNLWYFEQWLKERGIDYIEWSEPGYDRPGILVTGPVSDGLLAEAGKIRECGDAEPHREYTVDLAEEA